MEKNNKLIAEFIGMQYTDIGWFDNEGQLSQFIYDQTNGNCHDELYFDKSWDWLMSVVEKIELTKIKDYSISTYVGHDKTLITVYHYGEGGKWITLISNINEKYRHLSKIERTYTAVVEFINFYNKEREEK